MCKKFQDTEKHMEAIIILFFLYCYYYTQNILVTFFFLSDRLVELRVVLERIRPLEDKLKYQIDKFLKVSFPLYSHMQSIIVCTIARKDRENSITKTRDIELALKYC